MYVFGGGGFSRGLSVNGSSVTAEHAAALHGFAEANVSMTCAFSTARRREGGICWRCFWKNSSGDLMRPAWRPTLFSKWLARLANG